MNIIFAGTPEFAVPALQALIEAGHTISMVLTQPDRPSGRGMKLKQSPVKELALQHNISVFQPETLKTPEAQASIAATNADVMIVAAYGLIIPTVVLNMPKIGCYNIHASLLPRWRGAAPIQRSILAGDTETGITIMEVVPALDAGAMVSKGSLPITENDTAQTLHDGLSALGASLMVSAMRALQVNGHLPAEPQDESLVTYAHKLEKAESPINWSMPAHAISRQVRAFNPFPVATTQLANRQLNDETCRIWMATATTDNGKVGHITSLANGITVACGNGSLNITELQMPGGKRLSYQQFLQGHPFNIGDAFADIYLTV